MTTNLAPKAEPSSKAKRLLLPGVCLSLATVVSAVTSLNVALPDLARDTGASQTQISWVVDAYALVFASLLLVGGVLGDRYGRRLALLGGLSVFGVGSLLSMFTTSVDGLIGLRGLLGIGAALVMPATLSTITTVYADKERLRAIGIWSGVAGASAVLGLVVSGTLLEFFSWRAVFGLNITMAVIAAIMVVRAVPESVERQAHRLDIGGALLFVVSISALIYSIIEAPTEGWTSAHTLIGLGFGFVMLAATVTWELLAAHPLLDPRLFTNRMFSASALSITVQFAAFFGFVFLMIQYLQLVAGLAPLVAALCMLPMAAGLMGSSRNAFRVTAKLGQVRTCVLGLVLIVIAMGTLSTLGADINYVILFVGLPVLGAGMGLAMTPATSALTEALPADQQGVASAMNDLARELGGAVGIAVLGSVLASTLTDRLGATGGIAQLAHADGAAANLARSAFADGLGNSLTLAAIAVALTAVAVAVLGRRAV
ncbi:MFS transporter [Antrihabitans stalactiti]|uniref:MFS transporter n=1 Tax=Antrihabitans stalactiti TaxID=2584121 RepID=A0A848KP16_9NOCA|nr:MFS transporter [Antrihabitans stalactiti]NMN98684.1 MFS transporter [Antrihabitans stalactiti]